MKLLIALALSFSLILPSVQGSFAAKHNASAKKEVKKEVKKVIKKETKKKEVKNEVKKKTLPPQASSKAKEAVNKKVPAEAPKKVEGVTVTIKDFKFDPAELTVKKGAVVTWVNQDSARHNAHSTQTGGPNGGLLGTGEKYAFTANTVGSFDYVCDPHSGFMKGKLIVTE